MSWTFGRAARAHEAAVHAGLIGLAGASTCRAAGVRLQILRAAAVAETQRHTGGVGRAARAAFAATQSWRPLCWWAASPSQAQRVTPGKNTAGRRARRHQRRGRHRRPGFVRRDLQKVTGPMWLPAPRCQKLVVAQSHGCKEGQGEERSHPNVGVAERRFQRFEWPF